MGRRNIYVNPEREVLFDEAAAMAGSLSAAIDSGLEMYVRSVRAGWLRTDDVERPVGRGEQAVRQQFRARFVDECQFGVAAQAVQDDGRAHGVEVFQGISGRLAAWHWSDPDWSSHGRRQALESTYAEWGELPDDWFERWGEELTVFSEVDELADYLGWPEGAEREALRRRVLHRAVQYLEL